ncbi:hypothetical protein EDC01DRAFT_624674 [Geopyxis carbonaria]|nr:hypothetical protein EDC01DRAFT_624674 [Geopyxis carbonaria]
MLPRLLNIRHARRCTQGKTVSIRWLSSSKSAPLQAARSVPPASPSLSSPSSFSNRLPRTIASLVHKDADSTTQKISDPAEPQEITLHGWVRTFRKMKKVCFAGISDGSTFGTVQAVIPTPQAAGLSIGSSVRLTGKWIGSSHSGQAYELQAEHVQVLGEGNAEEYPIQNKYQTPEFLRTLPHLRPRIPRYAALLHLRSFLTSNLMTFFAENEFVQCSPPIITSSDCENAGEVFSVVSSDKEDGGFFKTPKYLTVSTQLHLEALASAVPRVWSLSPTFRAEKSQTNRHLCEFYMLEAELSFIETLDPLLDFIETMIKNLVTSLMQARIGKELLSLDAEKELGMARRWSSLIQPGQWARITYTSAIELLQTAVKNGDAEFEFPLMWGTSLQTEHEKYLAAHFGPVFVTDYPRDAKPFYMLTSPATVGKTGDSGETVACFDLLLPDVGELIGGSLREHRYEELLQRMQDAGMSQGELEWYTELRKFGSVPHGGFGMGMERLMCYLANVENIREVVAFPRWVGRCDC